MIPLSIVKIAQGDFFVLLQRLKQVVQQIHAFYFLLKIITDRRCLHYVVNLSSKIQL
jgi:hypothetical protein